MGSEAWSYWSIWCAFRFSSEISSSADSSHASSFTFGATPASHASCHRLAHKHQQSASFRPGKSYSGNGVLKSFPFDLLKRRKFSVICAQITCLPPSCESVSQDPLRYHPVLSFWQHGLSGRPNTFLGPSFSMGAIIFTHSSLIWISLKVEKFISCVTLSEKGAGLL